MKKLRIFTLLLTLTLTITSLGGALPFFKELITIPANAWSPTSSDWVSDQIPTPAQGYAYSFAVIGDTQSLLWYDLVTGSNNMDKMYDWIVSESKKGNIDLVMGLGDITETNNNGKSDYPYSNGAFNFTATKKTYTFNNSSTVRKNEWLYAKSNIDKLADNNIPYTIVRGNHDKPSSTVAAEYRFNQYFKYDEYASHYADGMVGRYDGKYYDGTMHNTYLKVEIAGVKYMIVNLDCGVSSHKEKADDILEWANRVVAANKDYKVIVTTHEYLSSDGQKPDPDNSSQTEYYGLYNGQTIWNKFARKHENIFLILSGHHKTHDIGKSQTRGDNGNTVTQMMIDPQRIDMPENYPSTPGHGGTGLVAMLHFSKDGKTLDVEYYSVIKDKYFRTQNQFSLNLNALDNKKTYTDTNHTHAYSGSCDAICDLCLKTTRTAPSSHTYYNKCDPDCNVCNTTRNASHSYTSTCDATCNNGCGTVRTPPHSFDNGSCSSCEFPTYQNFRYTIQNNEATVTKYTGSSSSVSIPSSINGYPVAHIGEYAFEKKTAVTSVTIPSSVKTIGVYAFNGCTKLATVTNNSTVMTAINGNAFYACSKLTGIKLPSTLCYIGEFAFYGCSKLNNLTLPAGVTAIERLTFDNCTSLVTLNMPNTLNVIRHHAFFGCTGLKKLVFPSSLTVIEKYAFCDCSGVTTIVLPSALKKIASYAFHCKNLKYVYYEGTQANKSSISIDYTVHSSNGRNNNALKNATWYYSACIANTTSYTHSYSTACDTECNNCLKTTRTASGHTYTNSCDPDCNACNAVRTIVHTYDNSCDTVCNICSATRTVNSHVFSNNCDADCNVCGAKRIAPHVFDNENDVECNSCKAIREYHTEHEYDNDCDVDCNLCGEERTASHTYSANCDAVCDVCNETAREITENDHTYEYPCSTECTYCKKARAAEHEYDNDSDPECNYCNAVRELSTDTSDSSEEEQSQTNTESESTPDTIPTSDGDPRSSNTFVIIIIIIIALVAVAAGIGIGCWIFFKKKKNK